MTHLNAEERQRGVVAFSSGNHAQGVAAAARMLCVSAVIVMPSDAPRTKVADTRAWGAEVVLYDRIRENRETIAAAIADADGRVMIRPFDDPLVIAGQGTIGLELVEQASAMGGDLDAVLVPCSGVAAFARASRPLLRRTHHARRSSPSSRKGSMTPNALWKRARPSRSKAGRQFATRSRSPAQAR
jgi:threonine dehydratase